MMGGGVGRQAEDAAVGGEVDDNSGGSHGLGLRQIAGCMEGGFGGRMACDLPCDGEIVRAHI